MRKNETHSLKFRTGSLHQMSVTTMTSRPTWQKEVLQHVHMLVTKNYVELRKPQIRKDDFHL
jgi:hypothetical protein